MTDATDFEPKGEDRSLVRQRPLHRPEGRSRIGRREEAPGARIPESDMAKAVGAAGWWRLEPAIRARFSRDVKAGQVKCYEGMMSQVACSKIGWLLAQACRLLGTPLATAAGREVPTTVLIYPDPSGRGTVWDRIYFFPEKKPVTVRSSKVLDEESRLLERVGGGFGMLLRVFEQDRALHMVSRAYFLEWRGRRIPLPALLSPGTAHVIHSDEGGGRFRFRLTITHPALGCLFSQDGHFADEPKAPSHAKGWMT